MNTAWLSIESFSELYIEVPTRDVKRSELIMNKQSAGLFGSGLLIVVSFVEW